MNHAQFERRLWLGKVITQALILIITVAATLIILTTALKIVWNWVVPDLFPLSVERGFIVKDISWFMALKLIVLTGLVTAGGRLIAIPQVTAAGLFRTMSDLKIPGIHADEQGGDNS